MKKTILFIIAAFVLIGFANSQKNNDKAKEAKLVQSANELFKITNVSFKKDTMVITSLSDFLFYPFGKYSQSGAFVTKSKLDWYRSVNKFTFNDTLEMTIYKFWRLDDSYLNFYISIDSELMELISGNVTDKEVRLQGNIHTGITKQALMNVFFTGQTHQLIEDIKYVRLTSGWHDLTHLYVFEDDVLKRILFDTNYKYY